MDINIAKPVLLVDSSYFVFYRYYATQNWYRFQDDAKEECMSDPVFVDKYDKMFEKTLVDIKTLYNVEWDNTILVKDCSRDTIWRNKHYKEYKGTRDNSNKNFDKEVFVHTYKRLLPRLKTIYGFADIHCDDLEADDVVAIMHRTIRKLTPDTKIYIITNDNDYTQLCDNNTIIKNLQGKTITTEDSNMFLKMKIIQGDKSDNIPAIAKKIGPKTAEKIAADLETYLDKNPEARKIYDLNKLLIDFKEIPSHYEEIVNDKINYIKKN